MGSPSSSRSSASTPAAPCSPPGCRSCSPRLHAIEVPLGDLDIAFYRDDVTLRGGAPVVHSTHLDFDIDGRTIVIVDDVMFTGRTVRAAIEALFDYGRPARVQLAVLADRGHRELPVRPDYVGKNLPTARGERVNVHVVEIDGEDSVSIADDRGGSALMRHLLSINDLTRDDMERILDRAAAFEEVSDRDIKKVPALRGRTVLNLFYEASTRTRSSFELAAKRLSADVVNFSAGGSSVEKGESLKDTVLTLTAHSPDAIVIRTPFAGAAALVAGWTPRRSSTPATASTSIRPRPCSTPTRCARSSARSRAAASGSSATSRTRGWRARTSSPSARWAPT